MSPEQARGKVVDSRTDIWAFGCLLYEMLTGRSAFAGETVTDVLASVIGTEPDWKTLPATVSPAVQKLIRRCLEKDASRRFHHIADVRLEIEDMLSGERRRTLSSFRSAGRLGCSGVAGLSRPCSRSPRS